MVTSLLAQLLVDGVYTSYKQLEASGTTVVIGPDVDMQLRPNIANWTWDNASLDLDPSNPQSALYGKIGRNTACRLRLGSTPLTVFAGEATDWEPDETLGATASRGLRQVDFSAAGVASRVGKWTDPIDSAMLRKQASIPGLIGYWPGEGGGSDTVQLSEQSGVFGAAPGSVSGTIDFGGDPGPGGGDTALKIGTGGALAARFARVTTSGWQAVFHAKLPAVPSSGTYLEMFGCNLSNGNRVQWMVNNNSYLIQVIDPFGAVKGSYAATPVGVDPTNWVRYRIKATFSGGTVTIEPAWYAQDAPVIYGVTFTYADSGTGALLNWQVSDNTWTDGAAYGHIFATSNTAVDLTDTTYVASFNGYLGEFADDRIARLGGEQGLSISLVGAASSTARMGRQKPDTLINLFEECRVTDGGVLYDSPTFGNITYRIRAAMLNQTPALTLTKGTTAASPLKPVVGDKLIVNDVTVKNRSGESAHVVVTSGSMSVADAPAGVGRYRKSLDVNLSNALLLADRGTWETNVGTTDRRWYKTITVDLLSNPSLINTLIGLQPGQLISLVGAEFDTVGLIFLSAEWTIQNFPVKVVLTCVPADAYTVGVYDATTSRKDSTFATTASSATTTATTIAATNPVLADCWSTTATPYPIKVTGEVMTVTAATAPAGTGPFTQILTVTRSVNGVVKTHAANEPIRLATPVHYGFV